ncbi:MAG: prepilin-type N-terminal cleavage/methylation domain-containing protein [Acaryochloris sp. RU_4_1]|nr:prepilin-type N-terminal cleavage/methylation domain-containing protein [Acaryochloris sp. RU_4_1]
MNNIQLYINILRWQRLTLNKQYEKGFTLIELLIVVIIIGTLSAIALPSMLSQARKAREAGAQNDLGAVNRSQQAYRLEHAEFASNVNYLNISVPTSSNGYTYALGTTNATQAEFKATPSSNELQAFIGCATASSITNMTTTSITIEAASPGSAPPSC